MSMFPRAMWRFLTPYLLVAFLITGAAAYVYEQGAAAWVILLGATVALLVVIPAYARWEDRRP
jgi:hypothetical protein